MRFQDINTYPYSKFYSYKALVQGCHGPTGTIRMCTVRSGPDHGFFKSTVGPVIYHAILDQLCWGLIIVSLTMFASFGCTNWLSLCGIETLLTIKQNNMSAIPFLDSISVYVHGSEVIEHIFVRLGWCFARFHQLKWSKYGPKAV